MTMIRRVIFILQLLLASGLLHGCVRQNLIVCNWESGFGCLLLLCIFILCSIPARPSPLTSHLYPLHSWVPVPTLAVSPSWNTLQEVLRFSWALITSPCSLNYWFILVNNVLQLQISLPVWMRMMARTRSELDKRNVCFCFQDPW